MINWLKKQIRSLYTTGYHPRDPALVRWFYGSNIADAGVHVDEYSALTYSAVWAATRRITESIAGLPIRTYTKIESRREEVTDHPSAVLLATRPNPEMTWFTFLETLQAHVLLWGNAYAEIVFDAGQPVELWPITPNRVVPRRDGKDLKYDIYPGHWLEHPRPSHRLSPFQMVHVKGLGFDGLRGYSVVEMAKQSIGLGLAEEQFGAKYFGNGARPDGVLQTPNTMDAEAQKRLREQWEELYGGPSRAGRVAVLEEGLEYNKITIPPNDSQFLESRQFQIADIARWFNIQPHMIGDLSRSTFSNIEVQGQEFVTYTLRPWFVRWEQELNTKLWPFEPGIYETEFDADELIRGTITTRYQSYNTGRNGGWLSFNDIRRSENLPTIDEEWANQYWWPLNIGIAGEPPPEPPTPPPEGQRSGDFKEEEHPRAPDGKFGSGGGSNTESDDEDSNPEKEYLVDDVDSHVSDSLYDDPVDESSTPEDIEKAKSGIFQKLDDLVSKVSAHGDTSSMKSIVHSHKQNISDHLDAMKLTNSELATAEREFEAIQSSEPPTEFDEDHPEWRPEPEEPPEPDIEEPDEDNYEDENQYKEDLAKYEKAYEDYDKAYDKWSDAHDKWESYNDKKATQVEREWEKWSKAYDRAESKIDKLGSKSEKLSKQFESKVLDPAFEDIKKAQLSSLRSQFKEDDHPRAPDGKFGSGGDVHEVTKDDLVDDKWDKAKKVGKTILSVVNAMPTASKYLVKEAGYSEKVQNVALAVATIGDWSVPGIPAGSALVSAFALASSPTIPYKLAKKAVQGVMSKIKKRSTRSEDEFTIELAEFLASNDFDTALMVFSAALDETGDPSHALDVAKEAIKEVDNGNENTKDE